MIPEPGWVLVVDDDATERLLLFRLLERDGHHATVADDGRAALALLRAEPFDLVLLDLLMPDLDGYALLEAIKADVRLRSIPVIILSAADELASIVRCIELGADDYLDKPVDPVLLRTRVGSILTKKRLRDREDEYADVVGHLVQAATEGTVSPDGRSFDALTRRTDGLGALARALRDMTARVADPRRTAPTSDQ